MPVGKELSKGTVLEILSEIRDPGVPLSIVEMGIVSEDWIHNDNEGLQVEFRPSSPFCPVGVAIGVMIKYALEQCLNIQVKVRVLRGSHLQESLVNELLRDRRSYLKTLKRLKATGFVTRCFSKSSEGSGLCHNKANPTVTLFLP
ncbi:MAG: DUF59 domain-containing protein [Methanobacteriota archaeon]|nr:MAG: DUF59 domain-containing protein [Euryarchaeota archaeon]